MFADFFKRLTASNPEPFVDEDARIALGALLVRVAKTDGNYAVEEISWIDQILANRYDINPVEAAKLRAQCELAEREAPDTVRFTKAIKEAVAYEDREAVIEALWQIVLADGQRLKEENALLRMIAPMLGVQDLASNTIRKRIEDAAT